MVNFELYKYFYYVARYKSVSKAAEKLIVTQSAVSQAIKQLEQNYNKNLFIRSSKGMNLTQEGELLYNYVSLGIKYFLDADDKIRDIDDINFNNHLVVASTPILAKQFLFPHINNIINKFSVSNIDIKEFNNFDERISAVLDGYADIAIVKDTKDYNNSQLVVKQIAKLSYVFFYNPKFFKLSETVSLYELSKLPLILKKSGTNTKTALNSNVNVKLSPIIGCSHDDLIIELVKQGSGVGFAPKEYLSDELKILNVKDYKSFSFNILAVFQKNNKKANDIIKMLTIR